ncbi:sulfite exporter TauE/SafE family protein [Amycolatopsis palatopharyngis]|uniref:sulfite exporter TauE/SafE family protein n=1 Tax=Amycolatopsis palatopharyngis TaxID=187982 RepID=UPI000E24A8FF|nr:sulfite exporter TauE/SafE family protein [Amycolatopsis palatopharyngis]
MISVALALAGLVVLAGALIQGAAGFGMNLIAAPLLALADPRLVPVPLLLIAGAHAVLSMAREWHDIDWPGVRWAMLGRLPGTILGVVAVATLAPRPFAAIVGASVLICGLLSVTSWRPTPTPGPLLLAGVASGTFGTAASIGGPPLALLYQHSSGRQIRATLAACFGIGTVISLTGLGIGGQIQTNHLVLGLALLPFLVVGFALSGPARRILDAGRTRAAVITIAMVSALVLLVRSLLG